MNRQRRKDLQNVIKTLRNIFIITDREEVIETLESAIDDLEYVRADEEEARDSMPDSLLFTARYDDMEDNIADLYDITGALCDMIDDIASDERVDASGIKAEIENVIQKIQTVIDR
ncbi:hypothetical protein E5358_12645 [Palleniella muris]|uniref:Uncharacterized protein n=1 Tax=Palleniella muris TaxID=3038145 RepID=A0AC61QMK7_9BACT|nr:hypothetical protein [Palleniella muris]TGX80499.1 hypothetical protein E5358_12645 [Palleniella muris]